MDFCLFRDGVSRLSAFHHFGMISPFKIARDALLTNSNGAQKYIDEFFTWREVAHAFCLRMWPTLESTGVIYWHLHSIIPAMHIF